eukprot:TRINITY_DN913_c0_g1_i1.p1 TRINITY_DN913_c0_g1~~TRINITY_DN913_c0_g1_i1.p1  ORF type:complete len:283 (+),score=49.36 TRINITY_DN913_c0_g1_i1:312-1160(+)
MEKALAQNGQLFGSQTLGVSAEDNKLSLKVSNLPHELPEETVTSILRQLCQVVSTDFTVEFCKDADFSSSKKANPGYCQLQCKNRSSASAIMILLSASRIDGSPIIVEWIDPRSKTFMQTKHKTIFVKELPKSVTESDLADFFGQFGTIEKTIVVRNPYTNESKGYGFVEYADPSGVDNAVSTPVLELNGARISVDKARGQGPRPSTVVPGTRVRGGGGGGGRSESSREGSRGGRGGRGPRGSTSPPNSSYYPDPYYSLYMTHGSRNPHSGGYYDYPSYHQF